MTILEASATANDTIATTTYTLLDSMTLTPGAGDYLAVFSTDVEIDNNNEHVRVSLFVAGVQVAHSEREFYGEASIINTSYVIATSAYVSPGDSEAVEVRWLRDAAGTATAKKRTLNLIPVASADVTQVTATGDTTMGSATPAQLDSMTITPGAGDYLLMFTTSAQGPATTQLTFAVYVNGTIVSHTARKIDMEGSIPNTSMPVAIYAKVSPGASEVVEIKWSTSVGSGTITCHERGMVLYEVGAGQLFEANDAVTDTATNTTDTLLDSMTLTPGAGDYLAMFSESHRYGTIGGNVSTYYSLYVNSVQTAHTERESEHDGTIDNSNIAAMTNGKVSPGAAEDVEIQWRASAADSRDGHERTFVLLKEAAGGTETPQAVAGALTSTGTIVKQVSVSYAGTLTNAGILATIGTFFRALSGTLTSAGTIAKKAVISYVGVLTSSGVIETAKTVLISLAGALTNSGTVIKQTAVSYAGTLANSGTVQTLGTFFRSLVGTLTSTGTIVKETAISHVGTLTSSGTVQTLSTFFRAFVGTLTNSGVVVKETIVIYVGTLTSSGTIQMFGTFFRAFSGTLTNTGIVVKRTAVSYAGVLTSSGTVVAVLTFLRSFAGTLTSSGTIAKDIAVSYAGTLTSAGIITKKTIRALAGTLASSGVVGTIRTVLISLAGSLTSSGTVVRNTAVSFIGTLTLAGTVIKETAISYVGTLTSSSSLIRKTITLLAGTLTSVGDLATQFIGGAGEFFQALAGTLTPSGNLTKRTSVSFAGTLTSVGVIVKDMFVSLSGTLTLAGDLTLLRAKLLIGTLASSGTIVRQTVRSLSGTLSSAGLAIKDMTIAFAGTLASSGVVSTILNITVIYRALTVRARGFAFTVQERSSNLVLRSRDFLFTLVDRGLE